MEIFSNWIFWVILASIVFVLALIGYLTESMKKTKEEKKEEPKEEEPTVNTETVDENVQTEVKADDWMDMPKVETMDEVKVDTIGTLSVDNNSTETPVAVSEATPTEEVTPEVSTLEEVSEPTTETLDSDVEDSSNIQTPVENTNVENTNETSTEEKNNDIWNL